MTLSNLSDQELVAEIKKRFGITIDIEKEKVNPSINSFYGCVQDVKDTYEKKDYFDIVINSIPKESKIEFMRFLNTYYTINVVVQKVSNLPAVIMDRVLFNEAEVWRKDLEKIGVNFNIIPSLT